MFQFSRFAHYMHPFFKWLGFPIRKSADQFIFADPRGLSQLITSFIASESQGIPRVPFLTFFYSCAFCAARYAFFDSCCVFRIRSQESSVKTEVFPYFSFFFHLPSLNNPLLLSSLSIYFFQYVKERTPKSPKGDFEFSLPL